MNPCASQAEVETDLIPFQFFRSSLVDVSEFPHSRRICLLEWYSKSITRSSDRLDDIVVFVDLNVKLFVLVNVHRAITFNKVVFAVVVNYSVHQIKTMFVKYLGMCKYHYISK